MIRLASGVEVFVEARRLDGVLAQVGFAEVVSASPREVALRVEALPSLPQAPGAPATLSLDELVLEQRVRLRLSDDSGSYFADSEITRLEAGGRVVIEPPERIEVEWERSFFRIDVRLPVTVRRLDGVADAVPLQCTSRDASGGGLRLNSQVAIDETARVALSIQLPSLGPALGTRASVSAMPAVRPGGPVARPSMSVMGAVRPSIPAMGAVRPSMSIPAVGSPRASIPAMAAVRPGADPAASAVTTIECEARVVRCKMSWTTAEVTYEIGLQFVGIAERTRDRLISYLLDEQRRRKSLGLDERPSRLVPRA